MAKLEVFQNGIWNNGDPVYQIGIKNSDGTYETVVFDLMTETEAKRILKTCQEEVMRNYRKEYDNYHSSSKQKKNRAGRNAARRKMSAAGKVKKGDGKDVHHKDRNPKNNKRKNLRVVSKSKNRSFRRT